METDTSYIEAIYHGWSRRKLCHDVFRPISQEMLMTKNALSRNQAQCNLRDITYRFIVLFESLKTTEHESKSRQLVIHL